MNTDELLDERNQTHGSFIVNSRVSQGLKDVVRNEPGYSKLKPIHREALDHIFGKIGRILAGQAGYNDHWDDISGYGKLPVKFSHGDKEIDSVQQLYTGTDSQGSGIST